MKKILSLVALAAVMFVGCSKSEGGGETSEGGGETIKIESVKLDKTSVSVTEGKTVKLTATITPENATNDLVWSSSKESVATVSSDGTITGVAKGTAKVKVYSKANTSASATCAVTVVDSQTVLVTEITFNEETYEVDATKTLDLSAEIIVKPENATDKSVEWMSADESIATVNADGLLTAKMPGKVMVYATALDGSYTEGEVRIVVNEGPDTGKGVAVTRCNTTYGFWTSATEGAVLEMDNADYKTGTGSVKATIYNTGAWEGEGGAFANSFIYCYLPDTGEEVDCSNVWNNGTVLITLYISDKELFNHGSLYPGYAEDGAIELGSGGKQDEYELQWHFTLWRDKLAKGWNNIELKIADGSETMGTPDPSAINWFRLYYTCLKSGDVVKLDQVRVYND